jgi:hypothetical protein
MCLEQVFPLLLFGLNQHFYSVIRIRTTGLNTFIVGIDTNRVAFDGIAPVA